MNGMQKKNRNQKSSEGRPCKAGANIDFQSFHLGILWHAKDGRAARLDPLEREPYYSDEA